MRWYRLNQNEVLEKLQTSEAGLSLSEAGKRLLRYGPNRIAEEEKINRLKILVHQFTSPLIYILIIAGMMTIYFREYVDAGVIFFIVVLNAIIGFIQEHKAEESVRALKRMAVPTARVLRTGLEKEIESGKLVPGDIVLIASGAKIPADIRLLHSVELKIDEAMLTGESVPVEKVISPLEEEELIPGDQINMAFMGTIVVSGRARGVVVETGENTILGSIAGEIKEIGLVEAPIQKKIERFAKAIGVLVLAASSLLFIAGLIAGESIREMFMTAVAAAVAAIPEGLPIVVTIAFAVGVSRMARHNAIIRKLPAVETLGGTTVICTDKTGTLTKNEMTVKAAYDGQHVYEFTGNGYEPKGEILHEGMRVHPAEEERLLQVLRIGLLCNESGVYEENGQYKADGDPTEAALIVSAMKAGLLAEAEKETYQQTWLIPFESERGYMATLFTVNGRKLIFVKGAPERILEMCETEAHGASLDKNAVSTVAGNFAVQGLRVLAFAWKEASADTVELTHRDAGSGLVFAGLQGMIDPPRPEAIKAIEDCKTAGIRVIMITGDHAITAKAIAEQMGISGVGDGVLTGSELESMSDEDLFHRLMKIPVFARVAPQHKLRLTEQLKRRGEIIAMTGDGVNDAPALKAAHIGIAMGRTGTDVAKEAADMILADDNFASIFAAVKEGRIVFDNLRKVTFFLIPTGVAAILSIAGAIVLGVPIPYMPAQLLWINLVTNGLQDVALAFEPGEKDVLVRSPRLPGEGIMSGLLIQRTVLVGLVISLGVIYTFVRAFWAGEPIEKARSVAVTTMVFFQFFQAFNSRSEMRSLFSMNPLDNSFLFFSMIAAFFAQVAFLYMPAFQWVFRTEPITMSDWLHILSVAATVIIAVEADKWLRRRNLRISSRRFHR